MATDSYQQTTLIRSVGPAPPWDFPNLLLSTLRSQDRMTAGRLTEWPNPRSVTSFVTTTSVQQTDDANRAFAQHRWPNPARRPAPALTWTQNLLQATLTPSTANPFSQTAWPLPDPVRLRDGFVRGSGLTNVLARPFRQTDWPIPRHQRPIALSWTVERRPTAFDELPMRQTEWPSPIRATVPALSFTQEHKPTTVDTLLVRQLSWPLPLPRVHAVSLLTWSQPRPGYYQDLQPFNESSWPIPKPIPTMREYGLVTHLEPAERPPHTGQRPRASRYQWRYDVRRINRDGS